MPVEAYVASWIEIKWIRNTPALARSRLMLPRGLKSLHPLYFPPDIMSRLMLPRGLKLIVSPLPFRTVPVEAYVASWIEMPENIQSLHFQKSRLMLPRGLKLKVPHRVIKGNGSRLMLPRGLKYTEILPAPRPLLSRLMLPRGLKCFWEWSKVW